MSRGLSDDKLQRLADSLQHHRAEAGLAQAELAVEAGVSQAAIKRMEQAEGAATLGTLHSIAVALDIPLHELIQDAAL